MESNNNEMGDFIYDVFITDTGSLGFTVYEKGEDADDEDTHTVDIFVSPTLIVTSI